MKKVRLAVAAAAVTAAVLVPTASAFANTGYEGQPGNQSSGQGGGGNGNGPTGYEGQPGNQGG
jgi:hypothetical protein